MMTIIKKITVTLLSLIVVAGAVAPTASVFAATFNTDPQDHPTLQVSNYTRNPGSGTNWSTSVSANAGEVISFLVYYHNTAADTANGTNVRVQLPSGAFTSVVMTGEVRANNAPTVSGSASVDLSSSQTLAFIPGSVSWYPDKSSYPHALLNGQNGSEIVSNGLAVGDIAGGWPTQGYVVFRAQVSNTGSTGYTGYTGYTGGNGYAPSATTNSVFSVTQSSASGQGVVNPNNSNTTAWFEYGTTQSFGSTAGNQTVGAGTGSTNITGYFNGLLANTTYYYRVVAQNSFGTTYGSTMTFTTQAQQWGNYYGYGYGSGSYGYGAAPLATTNSANVLTSDSAALSGSINPNNTLTNAWFEYGTTQSLGYTAGYQAIGASNSASTLTANIYNLSPNTTYSYRVVAQNSFGTTYGTIMNFTTGGSATSGFGSIPQATTLAAQSVFRNSALLNGTANPNGSLATAWFDWGTTTNLGGRTNVMPVGQTSYANSYSAVLSGLQADTTYYYRAGVQNSYGTAYGNTMSFTTAAAPVVPIVTRTAPAEPRVIVVQSSAQSGSTVTLVPSIDKKNPNAGDTIEYTIQYRNDAGTPITNAVLQVKLPAEVTYVDATMRVSTSTDNTVTFDLGTIAANTQGVIAIKATVDRRVAANDALIFGATMTYTTAKKQFQSATAYLTVMVGSGVAGLASLFSLLGNLFTNWFVDLILGLLIGFGAYHFFVRQKEEEVLVK